MATSAVDLQPVDVRTDSPAPARTYVQEYTMRGLLWTSVVLYATKARPLLGVYLVPVLPTFALAWFVDRLGQPLLQLVVGLSSLPMLAFASGAITVTISDICLGNVPTVRRSYRKLIKSGLWLRLFKTNLMVTVGILLGMVLLLIPGMIFAIRALFAASIVTLEGLHGRAAVKRSFALTRGRAWSLGGRLLVLSVVIVLLFAAVIAATAVPLLLFGESFKAYAPLVVNCLMFGFAYPILFIASTLLYYDVRVREEFYDPSMLYEDMMR